jgi:hypothetical protein
MKQLLSSKARPLWALLAFLVVLLPLTVFLVKHGQSALGSETPPTPLTLSNTSTLTSIPTATPTPDFSAFVGEWGGHGRTLTFTSKGRAKYIARAYQWCGPGVPPPCDLMQNNTIIDGINEEMLFTYRAGNTAYGTITASSAGDMGRSVSLAVDANDTAMLTKGGDPAAISLCGPNAPSSSCGA